MRNIYYQYSKNILVQNNDLTISLNNNLIHKEFNTLHTFKLVYKPKHWSLNGVAVGKSSRFDRPQSIDTGDYYILNHIVGEETTVQNISSPGHGLKRHFFGLIFK